LVEAIRNRLLTRGEELLSQPYTKVCFTKHSASDDLLNDLADYPHAFVIACLMDRQVRAERAWHIPYQFKQRLGSFEIDDLQKLSLEEVTHLMTTPTPLHRMCNVMAKVFFLAVQQITQRYSGDASAIWSSTPSSAAIVRRFLEFHGASIKIATMAANILVRAFKIPVSDKISIDISPDIHVRRVFKRLELIEENASNDELVYRARELNPTYPGIFDMAAWEIGREWCRPNMPICSLCYMNECCPTAKKLLRK
jgi:endonuclease-3